MPMLLRGLKEGAVLRIAMLVWIALAIVPATSASRPPRHDGHRPPAGPAPAPRTPSPRRWPGTRTRRPLAPNGRPRAQAQGAAVRCPHQIAAAALSPREVAPA